MAAMMPALDNILVGAHRPRARRAQAIRPPDAPDKPGRDVVFDKGFPRPGGFARSWSPLRCSRPTRVPDEDFPFILDLRQLEHWHTGCDDARPCSDTIEPTASAQLSRGTIEKLGIRPGDMVRVSTRRGTAVEALRPPGRRGAGRRRVHPVRLRRSGREPAHQPEARSVRQDPRVPKFCAATRSSPSRLSAKKRQNRGAPLRCGRSAFLPSRVAAATPAIASAMPLRTPHPWCLIVQDQDDGWVCAFDTFEKCEVEARSGNTGFCAANPFYQAPASTPRPARHNKRALRP